MASSVGGKSTSKIKDVSEQVGRLAFLVGDLDKNLLVLYEALKPVMRADATFLWSDAVVAGKDPQIAPLAGELQSNCDYLKNIVKAVKHMCEVLQI